MENLDMSIALRREDVIAVASSRIAALLLPGGRTAHSRFQIPINVTDTSTCAFKQGSHLAKLMTRASLIIWDEAPMAHRNCFEAVDRSLRDIYILVIHKVERNHLEERQLFLVVIFDKYYRLYLKAEEKK